MHALFYGAEGVYDLWIGDRESSVSYVFERYTWQYYFLATKFCIYTKIW
jgi:hypothetical protein